MPLTRRTFVHAAGTGLAALAGNSLAWAAGDPKNWVWIPTGGARRSADDWKRRLALMRESGIRAIIPEIYDGRNAWFGSTRLPVKTAWLETLLPLARAESIEVHAWMWCMPCMIEDVMKNHPDWYNVNAKGESAVAKPAYIPSYKFLDPGRPEVREFVQGTVKELASISELTGVHLDYIRHPDAILPSGLWKKYNIVQDKVYPPYDYGYSDYERNQFKQKYGADPMTMKDPKLEEPWLQFRCDMVTGLVNGYLAPAARAKGKKITAAVFPGPRMARTMVRQDWGKWNLDAFLPMLYNQFYDAGPEWVEQQTREGVAAVKQPVYSGLFVQSMTEAVFAETVQLALKAGASGVSLFSDGGMDDVKWKALQKLTAAGAKSVSAADPAAVLESTYSVRDFELTADPNSELWSTAPHVTADRNYLGQTIPGAPTEIRSRWSGQYLYLLYICPYDELNLKPDPNPTAETPELWKWDVAEAFIGSDFEHIARYKELQVSPQSEWVDLDIDRDNPKTQAGMSWNSGYTVKGRIDAPHKVWYGEMRIPFGAIDRRPPQEGRELRIGLFRIAGAGQKKAYYAWRPPGGTSFHVPQAFGTLRLRK